MGAPAAGVPNHRTNLSCLEVWEYSKKQKKKVVGSYKIPREIPGAQIALAVVQSSLSGDKTQAIDDTQAINNWYSDSAGGA